MAKFFIFWILWLITGNPFFALFILFIILYLLDRRFIGLLPGMVQPIRRNRRIRQLKQNLLLNPHHTSNKQELAEYLMEKKRYQEALSFLREVQDIIPDSADVQANIGRCLLKLGRLSEGEQAILDALEKDPRIHYGEPYLHLGEAYRSKNREKALFYLKKFPEIHSSSSEAYYHLGRIYADLGRQSDSRNAYQEAIEIYKSLPKYKKRSERPWALRSKWRLTVQPLFQPFQN
ncbi:tetratricopeptide repeat protein [Melghirimyces algeriensis]|uniref:Tetratricopeptide repeat-containing protein n=1 Tax=Melghirimyces algeriensis TaxID=910412 RepID=A0A521E210_9BACL|nr:tetratricopeptide repeat protein [Melghirimyces algeriensis]SMO78007.1 Tetratricopeptide repeat-containing protein [Melghirimyces algeriensis]